MAVGVSHLSDLILSGHLAWKARIVPIVSGTNSQMARRIDCLLDSGEGERGWRRHGSTTGETFKLVKLPFPGCG